MTSCDRGTTEEIQKFRQQKDLAIRILSRMETSEALHRHFEALLDYLELQAIDYSYGNGPFDNYEEMCADVLPPLSIEEVLKKCRAPLFVATGIAITIANGYSWYEYSQELTDLANEDSDLDQVHREIVDSIKILREIALDINSNYLEGAHDLN